MTLLAINRYQQQHKRESFFWGPLEANSHDTTVKALLRIAVVRNISVACNRAAEDFMISPSLMGEFYTRKLPDYTIARNLPAEIGAGE